MLWAVEEVIILTKLEMDWGKRMNDHEAIKEIIVFPVSNVPLKMVRMLLAKLVLNLSFKFNLTFVFLTSKL